MKSTIKNICQRGEKQLQQQEISTLNVDDVINDK